MSSIAMLDESLLADYLEANVPGFKGPLNATKFPGGQSNPTFRIDADSGTYVLRRQPPGKLLKSAHAGRSGVSCVGRAARHRCACCPGLSPV